jgi:hypothetical protein
MVQADEIRIRPDEFLIRPEIGMNTIILMGCTGSQAAASAKFPVWAVCFLIVITRGPGVISLDHLIARR